MYFGMFFFFFFFFSSRRRHTRFDCDWSSDVCSSDLEISVLSEPTRLPAPVDAMRVVVGRHGLMVRRERLVGLLLPQVAHEYHWGPEAFLAAACRKAGLPPEGWRGPGTEGFTFQADVFGEHEG